MTMEAFPHSGQQLASVHPCKHASVMKKFIDRMEAAQADDAAPGGAGVKSDSKKKWGLGGMMRRVTGGDKPATPTPAAGGEDEVQSGVQVDFYLVIVSTPAQGWSRGC
jgi:ubiquitin-like-conjugating enzyme ATG3